MDDVVEVVVGNWIRPRLTGTWATVTSIVPAGFSDYVRIFHPAMSDPEEQLHSWSQVAAVTGRTMYPEAQWSHIACAANSVRWPHMSPGVGHLDHVVTRVLFSVLGTRTSTPEDCYFGVWEGSGWAMRDDLTRPLDAGDDMDRRIARLAQGPKLAHPGRQYVVLHGATNEADMVGAYIGEPTFTSANLAWPADHAWCVATEVDYDSTIVACDHATAETILTHPDIEALAIAPAGRLDINADTINP